MLRGKHTFHRLQLANQHRVARKMGHAQQRIVSPAMPLALWLPLRLRAGALRSASCRAAVCVPLDVSGSAKTSGLKQAAEGVLLMEWAFACEFCASVPVCAALCSLFASVFARGGCCCIFASRDVGASVEAMAPCPSNWGCASLRLSVEALSAFKASVCNSSALV